jgi:hypothetical protein
MFLHRRNQVTVLRHLQMKRELLLYRLMITLHESADEIAQRAADR